MEKITAKLLGETGLLREAGQALVLVFVSLGVALFTVLFVTKGSQVFFQNSQYSYQAEQATAIAEAGADKALASLNSSGGSYNGESGTAFGSGTYSVVITSKDISNKEVEVTSYIPDKAHAKITRTITVEATTGLGLSFNYGMQIGEGGLQMGHDTSFDGSVYSNGNITGSNSAIISDDVFVAGAADINADQQSDCSGSNCQDFIFGKSVSGQNRQDIAQSFKPSVNGRLEKVSLKLKKSGNPSNPTVRIMGDNDGEPDKNDIKATATLAADRVSISSYGFIDITFNPSPSLLKDHTYWIMIHANSLDNSNYWIWSSDLAKTYNRGSARWSSNWQAHDHDWDSINSDLGFNTYMSGAITSINMSSGSSVGGNVHANTISGNFTINKNAFYQTLGSSITVKGSKNPNSEDPSPLVFPISDVNIADWEDLAVAGGTSGSVNTGNNCNITMGPKKIVGNLTVGNSCIVTIKTPIWVTGNLTVGNTSKFIMDSSFGGISGQIIVGGKSIFGNGDDLVGSGTAGSYLMLLSTYDSTQNQQAAIDIAKSDFAGIFYAAKGLVYLNDAASFNELAAYQVVIGDTKHMHYKKGYASLEFESGEHGSFEFKKGSYKIRDR